MEEIVKHSVIFSLTLYIVLACTPMVYSQESVITKDGKEVILHPDGRWTYGKSTSNVQTKPPSAKKLLKGKTGFYGLSIDESKWVQKKATAQSHEFAIQHVDGDVFGFTIPERIEVPLESMKEIILENAREGGFENVKIIEEENRIVNGKKFLFVVMEGMYKRIAMTFTYYVYSGNSGVLQFGTYTSRNLQNQYRNDIIDLLNGVEIYK
jgi:hypothetical protein